VESGGSSPKEQRPPSRISLQTLIIASIASAAASFAASRIWGSGTLVSAAATPVVVALVSEFLRRPVQTVAKSAKKVPTVQTLPLHRRTVPAPGDSTAAADEATATSKEDSETTGQGEGGAGHRWRLAVITGLLAFAIVVAVFTVPDLVAGHSITGNGQPTTFFGAGPSSAHKSSSVTTVTSTSPTRTVTTTISPTTTTKTTSSTATSTTTSSTATTDTSTSSPVTTASQTATTTTSPAP
jgi:hypothetical protein